MEDPQDNYGFWLVFPKEAKKILIASGVFYRNRTFDEIISDLRGRGADLAELQEIKRAWDVATRLLVLEKEKMYYTKNNRKFRRFYQRSLLEKNG